ATTQTNREMIRVVGKARTGDIVVAGSSNGVTTMLGCAALAARGSPEMRWAVESVYGRVRRQLGLQTAADTRELSHGCSFTWNGSLNVRDRFAMAAEAR